MKSSGRLLIGALALALLGMAACGQGKAGKLPVVNPTTAWVMPDADEIIPEDETEDANAGDAGDEE